MTTSGITSFTPNALEIFEEAFERAGRELRSGYDLRTARRSLNLLLIEWQSRGINMWTIDSGTIPLGQGIYNYPLPADTVDLLEHTIRTNPGQQNNQTDLNLTRISVSTYATIPNKIVQARPIQILVNRTVEPPSITIWPVPDRGTVLVPYYTLVYWRMRRIQDAGTGVNTPDISYRFYPALVAGLAFYISQKIPEGAPKYQMLKAEYEEQYTIAAGEDREKAAVRFVPRRQFIGRA